MNYVVHIRIKPTSRSVVVNSFIGLPPNGDDQQALIRDLSSQYGYSWVTIPGLTPVTGLPPGGITGQIVARDLDDPYGYVWVNPQSGPKGDDGEQGAPGDDGRSAYQVAVDNGFVGTEAEWLDSLNGAPGSPGADGDDGRSAYQVAVDNGFVGSESAWLLSLKGTDGGIADPIDEAIINNDFLSRNQGSSWVESAVSSGTTPQPSYAELLERPGVMKFNSSATANSGYYLLTIASYVTVNANAVTRLIFKLFDNDAFSTTKVRFGLHGATTSADGSN